MTHRRRAKAPKNTAKNTSKAPEEVDLTVKPTLPSIVVEQPKDLRIFVLNILVHADTTKLFSNVLVMPFGAFKYQEFIAQNTHRANEYYGLRSFQLDQSTAVIASSRPKDPLIPKEVNNADEWREVEGIIETVSKYGRKAWRVYLTVKYKAAAAPADASANTRSAEIAVAVQAALQAAGVPTKAAADEEAESSGEDHESVVEETAGKKASTTTKMQKEVAERRNRAEAESKHLYALLERHCCLQHHCKNKKHGIIHCLEFESKHYPIQPYHLARWSEAIEQKKATLDVPDLSLLSKIRYSNYLQDKEDKKDAKASSGSYKHRRSDSYSTDESTSSPPQRRQRRERREAYTTFIQSPANPIQQQDPTALLLLINQMLQQNQQTLQQVQNAIQTIISSSVLSIIANGHFPVDPTLNTRLSSVPSLRSAPSDSAPSSETPTGPCYPLPNTPSASLLPSSFARSNIEQSNSKLSAFIKWLQSRYPAFAHAFTEAESVLIGKHYTFKMLKHALLDNDMGHTRLHGVGLTYGLIHRMVDNLGDFRIDWRRRSAAAEALLDVPIGGRFISQ